ncbi:addiction module toxin, RelE StbE family [Lancefieldella rimae]|uniref:Addiction module toxin, RelE/StbE family n=2 Tax=Lancefieldella rimae TaxID=1383 RepID=B9CNN6_LANR4|nr:type II toxin-antitoxin system YafQ family toxin [Lancefieldella rimae]EEE16894.1 addiction module toxin, RelE/StbE family [Lancefieldella rimae ATCC 49626]KRO01939.1 addiction module toxin, RelE StbE family [Lancefieldella rimae]
MKFNLIPTTQFKKDYKRIKKRGYDMAAFQKILDKLCHGESLDTCNRDHALVGVYIGFRECHIKSDWLLIYAINDNDLVLTLSRTGTHADLFDE